MSKHFAVLGLYDKPDDLIKGIRALRGTWGDRVEAYTPYPIHGIEKELGIKKSFVGKMVLIMGLSGLTLALAFQSWAFMTDYQIRFGGKPYFSWASFVPIIFEVTVLLAAVAGAVGGMLFVANKLPHFSHPMLSSKAMAGITRDKLALAIHMEEGDDPEQARADLEAAGATSLEMVTEEKPLSAGPLLPAKVILTTALLCVLAGYGTWHLMRFWAELPLLAVMDEQQKVVPFRDLGLFEDAQSMRPPALGTVARGVPLSTWKTLDDANLLLSNPLPMDEDVLLEGRRVYETNCLVCHGQLGDGKKLLSDAYTAVPANLHSGALRSASDGYLYGVISIGKNTMAAYSKDLSPDERWACVHYLRVLQRSQNAGDADFSLARKMQEDAQ